MLSVTLVVLLTAVSINVFNYLSTDKSLSGTLQRFITDASHELKTPLTVIATSLKVLEMDIAPGLFCRGDEYAIRQLVSVLLDNAVKYADSGGSIRFRLEAAPKGAVLRVSNPCAGLDTTELDKLFDRFYRPDRSRSKQTGGFGVGLSIARSIVEAHHGSIRAECPEDGIIQFVVALRG